MMRFGFGHLVVVVDTSVVLAVNAVNTITGIGYLGSTIVVVGAIVASFALTIRYYDRYWERQLANNQ